MSSIGINSTSGPVDLSSLVAKQLSKVQQNLPRPNPGSWHIQHLRAMVDELSAVTAACVDYMDYVKEKPVSWALKEMEYAFEWPACLFLYLYDVQGICKQYSTNYQFHSSLAWSD